MTNIYQFEFNGDRTCNTGNWTTLYTAPKILYHKNTSHEKPG